MRRRTCLGNMAALATGALVWSGGFAPSAAGDMAVETETAGRIVDQLLRVYPRPESLAAVGHAYWQDQRPLAATGLPSLNEALQCFLDHLDLPAAELQTMPPADLHARIRLQTAADFTAGRTVQLRGWLLGESEARLCAVAALRAA